ncbi:MAG: CapA family protein [Oscillospiraceae bacterium]|nr:CapA family protein [Oscillospiraceae bacterium]
MMKRVTIYIIAAILLSGALIVNHGRSKSESEPVPEYETVIATEEPVEVVVQPTPEPKLDYISLFVLGDNLLHMTVMNSCQQADGSYDFSHFYENLQPAISNVDIAVIGQETVFGGAELGYSGYPAFNSPSDTGVNMVNEGFDVVLHASNHVLDMGAAGAENTIAFWDNYPDITTLGINRNQEEKDTVKIIDVRGAKLAMLNYTYGTNGIEPPEGKEYLVNYIDYDKIQSDVAYAEANADFTIAFMHWGTEYSITPDESQTDLAHYMCDWGVDLIVGSHPHVIEPVEWIESENGNRMLVYYSLGNFVSGQREARNLLGGIADITLVNNGSSVSIDDYVFRPIITHYNSGLTYFAVYPMEQYTDELASVHGVANYDGPVSLARWRGMLDETFAGYDTSLFPIELNY